MVIPTGMEYSIELCGSTIILVYCEGCGGEYAYQIERHAKGYGFSPLFLFNAWAQRKAEESARKSLRKQLDRGCEPVPCPHCGLYQQDMVREIGRRKTKGLQILGYVMLAVTVVIASVNLSLIFNPGNLPPMSWQVFALIGAIGPLIFAVRFIACRLNNPNIENQETRIALGKRMCISDTGAEKTAM